MILFWSAPAIEDLKAIRTYIAKDSEYYAYEFIQRILDAVENLSQFPEMGRVIPEIDNPSAREIVFHNYRILYRLMPDRIDISAVIHGRRDIRQTATERWEVI